MAPQHRAACAVVFEINWGGAAMSSTNATAPQLRVPTASIAAFGSLGMPIAALGLILTVYLPRHYVSLGVGFVAVAGAVAIVRLVDIMFDPIVAVLMDRTTTAIGRYRPWLLAGTPIVMLGAYKLLMPSGPVGPGYLILWLLVTYAGLSALNLGIAAWSAVLASSYNERSRVFTWLSAMGVLGAVVILLMPVLSGGRIVAGIKGSMATLGLMMIVAFPIALLICTTFTPERVAAVARPKFKARDYAVALGRPNLLRLVFTDLALALGPSSIGPIYVYFIHDVKNFTIPDASLLLVPLLAAGLVGAPCWGWLARRIGKHRAVQLACLVYAASEVVILLLPKLPPHYHPMDTLPIALTVCAVGIATSCFTPMVRAMVADVVDEVKLHDRADMTSLIFSLITTTTKVGSSVGVAIVFPILHLIHYNGAEGAVNTPGALWGLALCFLLTPTCFVLVGGAALFGYKLDGKRHAEIMEGLAALDVAANKEASSGAVVQLPNKRPSIAT